MEGTELGRGYSTQIANATIEIDKERGIATIRCNDEAVLRIFRTCFPKIEDVVPGSMRTPLFVEGIHVTSVVTGPAQ
jgi:hypothetical protein